MTDGLSLHSILSLLLGFSIIIAMINWIITVIIFRFKIKHDIEKRVGQKLVFTSIYHRISPWDRLLGGAGEMIGYTYIKFFREKIFKRPPGNVSWMADCALAKVNYQFDEHSHFEVLVTLFGLVNGFWLMLVGGLLYFHVINIDIPKPPEDVVTRSQHKVPLSPPPLSSFLPPPLVATQSVSPLQSLDKYGVPFSQLPGGTFGSKNVDGIIYPLAPLQNITPQLNKPEMQTQQK